jgi:hypothetical protein
MYDSNKDPEGYYLLNQIPKNEVFKRKDTAHDVYRKNHYNRREKDFSCSSQYDANKEVFIKANKLVYVGFTF